MSCKIIVKKKALKVAVELPLRPFNIVSRFAYLLSFTHAFPVFNNGLPATSLITIAAIIYQADKAQKIRTYPATTFKWCIPKCPKSKRINPISKSVNVIAIAEWIKSDPTQNIAVNNVQLIRK